MIASFSVLKPSSTNSIISSKGAEKEPTSLLLYIFNLLQFGPRTVILLSKFSRAVGLFSVTEANLSIDIVTGGKSLNSEK